MNLMFKTFELLPGEATLSRPLFETEASYEQFREAFIEEVTPQQERWQEARLKSEEEARQRLLR
jgi:hypothetical protein